MARAQNRAKGNVVPNTAAESAGPMNSEPPHELSSSQAESTANANITST